MNAEWQGDLSELLLHLNNPFAECAKQTTVAVWEYVPFDLAIDSAGSCGWAVPVKALREAQELMENVWEVDVANVCLSL